MPQAYVTNVYIFPPYYGPFTEMDPHQNSSQ